MKGIHHLIRKAGHFARRAHRGQRRKYRGSPYSHHPFRVARAVAAHEIGSPVTVAAALLHDTVEDTPVSLELIVKEFGPEVAQLVSELTKLKQPAVHDRRERFLNELARLEGISREAKVIKLLDRIDNVSESRHVADGFTARYLAESRQLAESLGEADPDLKQALIKAIEACCST